VRVHCQRIAQSALVAGLATISGSDHSVPASHELIDVGSGHRHEIDHVKPGVLFVFPQCRRPRADHQVSVREGGHQFTQPCPRSRPVWLRNLVEAIYQQQRRSVVQHAVDPPGADPIVRRVHHRLGQPLHRVQRAAQMAAQPDNQRYRLTKAW